MKRAIAFLLTAILAFGVCAVCFASYAKLPDPVYQWSSETGGAAGLLVAEADNGAVLYERNSSMEAKPGSLTVLMSALLLAEDTVEEEWDTPLDPLKSVNSTWSARAAQMGLKEGDTPTRRDLLYGMLLKGGADAAFTAAKLISGGETVFVEKMNEKAASLGMSGTRFENSCGLSSGMHYSNAHDMLILAAECMKHEEICEAFSSPAYACSGGVRGIELVNSNTAIGIEGCIGMKLGSDGGMENSLILLYERDGIKIITVLLEAASEQSAYSVSRELANEAFDHVSNELGGREAVPTYAVCRTEKAISLYKDPECLEVGASVLSDEALSVCGISEYNGAERILVYYNNELLWARADGLINSCVIDDIFIHEGYGLSSEHRRGEQIEAGGYVTSRHLIEKIKIAITAPDGTVVYMSEYSPLSHGICTFDGTSLGDSIASLRLNEGIYDCAVTVLASAKLPGGEVRAIEKTSHSTLSVGTGAQCVSYNANCGSDAPQGEVFLDTITVSDEKPWRFGYTFMGWNMNADGTGDFYYAGDNITCDDSFALYAVWQEADDKWDTEARFVYSGALSVEGFVENEAGIVSLRLEVDDGNETIVDIERECMANSAAVGSVLIEEPIELKKGEYTAKLFGTACGGVETLLTEETLTVVEAEATEAPTPDATEAPNENGGFSLASVPIAVWFVIGAVVVALLIGAIVYILKKG